MTPLATYFSKSKLMARFQSHQGVHFSKKKQQKKQEIGDLGVPDDVSFLWKPMLWCDWNRAMSLDFEKYVAKGVIGDLSCRIAFYQRCKLKNEKWNIFTRSPWVKNRSKRIMRMSTLCGYLVQRRDLVKGWKTIHKDRRILLFPWEDLWDGFTSHRGISVSS